MEYHQYNQYVYEFRKSYGYSYMPLSFQEWLHNKRQLQTMAQNEYHSQSNQSPQLHQNLKRKKTNLPNSDGKRMRTGMIDQEPITPRSTWSQLEEEVLIAS